VYAWRKIMSMWEMYDRLIEPIPDDVKIEDYFVGIQWTSVTVCGYTGATATNPLRTIRRTEKNILDMSWKEAAGLIKSWNFYRGKHWCRSGKCLL
jgi:uncharacterized protein (DUF4213/DUF364 family)